LRTPVATSTSPAAARAHDLEADHGLAVEERGRAPLGDGVADVGDLVEADAAAVGERDLERAELGRRLHGRDRSHRLLGAAEVGAAARAFLLDLAELPRDVGRGRLERLQPCRVELDAHLAADAADARHRADAAHREDAARHLIVDEPRQRLVVHPARRDRVGQDRRAGELHLGDDRIAQVGRQVGADARDRVADVVDRLLRGLFEAELDRRRRDAVLHRRVDVLDALQRRDRVLDLAGDLGLEQRRRRARKRRRRRSPWAGRCRGTAGSSSPGSSSGRPPSA
jgi:hypothetical protein